MTSRSFGRLFVYALAMASLPLTARADGGAAASTFDQALARGPFFALIAAFVGGLLVSLTPCVYPMIAITVSVFGARSAKSRGQAALLSGVFVLGIAAMFTALGVGAALTGALFGAALANRWVVSFLALVFLALSASMFGAFELSLPSSLNNRLTSVGGIGLPGAFALGLVSALVAAPCTGPVLSGILIWIATSHRTLLGTGVMFTFALGLGVPFFIVGTFAVALPKAGSWMLGTKWIFGVVLAVVALYFLRNAVQPLQQAADAVAKYPAVAFAMVAVGLVLAWFHVGAEKRNARRPELSKPFKLASIPLAIAGGFAIIAWVQKPAAELEWVSSESEGRNLALAARRPMIVDFGAAWCGACNELKAHTFADASVRSEAARFVAVNVDATDDDDAQTNDVKGRYGVVGLPTVVLLDSQGKERMRFVEFVPPERFVEALRTIN